MGHHQKTKSRNHEYRRRRDTKTKGIDNLFNSIIAENFQNLERGREIQVQEAYQTSNCQDQKRNTPRHIIIKTLNIQNKERIRKAAKGKR
jgi:hypothetical protein